MKTCTKCNESKSKSFFCKRKLSNDGLNHWCKPCVNKNNTALYHKDIEINRKKSREWDAKHRPQRFRSELKHKFGITEDNYNEMFNNQNGKCKICNRKESLLCKDGTIRRLAVDHCHSSSKIRGLLCSRCNTALGLFEDNISSLLEAIEYLKKGLDDV